MTAITRAVEDRYAVIGTVISLGDNVDDPSDPRVWSPLPAAGDGAAVLLRWTCERTAAQLHIIVTAPICTPQCLALLDLRAGDQVYVEGRVEGIHWPGLGTFAVMQSPADIEVVRRRAYPQERGELAHRANNE